MMRKAILKTTLSNNSNTFAVYDKNQKYRFPAEITHAIYETVVYVLIENNLCCISCKQ